MIEINLYPSYMEYKHLDGTTERKPLPYNGSATELHEALNLIQFCKSYSGNCVEKNKELEQGRLPEIGRVFYYNLYYLERIPTPDELVDSYVKSYCSKNGSKFTLSQAILKKHPEYLKSSFTKTELKGRLLRAYNSFIRELDLFLQINETENYAGYYEMQKDFYEGIDIIIEEKTTGIRYGIRSYIANARSNFYLNRKSEFRHDYSKGLISLKFPAFLSGPSKNTEFHNDIAVYKKEAIIDFLLEVFQKKIA